MMVALLWMNYWLWVVAIKNGDSGSMSLNIGFSVSGVVGSMMGILVGSWDDGADIYVTISADILSDGDWYLTIFTSASISSRIGWSTILDVWSLIKDNGGW